MMNGSPAAGPPDLTYVSQIDPGLVRRKAGRGSWYATSSGRRVRNVEAIARIRALVIPPAWTSVWICADANGHIQATGRDARGRKQYIYHTAFRAFRDQNKFDHLLAFVDVLPTIRARVAVDMAAKGMGRNKVLAILVALLERTLIRVGNEPYAKENGSYGLTTMLDPHVRIEGGKVRFLFTGKSGKQWNLELRDRRLAKLVRDCQDMPGQKLFQYRTETGEQRGVTSTDLNAYLRAVAGREITAKNFRTWAGTVLAAITLRTLSAEATELGFKKLTAKAVDQVSKRLGNTVTVCRQCYIHPTVMECFARGQSIPSTITPRDLPDGLTPDEAIVLGILKPRTVTRPSGARPMAPARLP